MERKLWEKKRYLIRYKILEGKQKGKRTFRRIRYRWEDNIKMNLKVIEHDNVDWILGAQDWDQWRVLVNTVTNLQVP
jgi:hypothetical protein